MNTSICNQKIQIFILLDIQPSVLKKTSRQYGQFLAESNPSLTIYTDCSKDTSGFKYKSIVSMCEKLFYRYEHGTHNFRKNSLIVRDHITVSNTKFPKMRTGYHSGRGLRMCRYFRDFEGATEPSEQSKIQS